MFERYGGYIYYDDIKINYNNDYLLIYQHLITGQHCPSIIIIIIIFIIIILF